LVEEERPMTTPSLPVAGPPWEERLFLPGPTPIPWPIAQAMARPMADLRGAVLRDLAERVESGVARLFGTAGRAVAIAGTGTATLEAVVQSLFAPGERVLAVVVGAFGARFARVAEGHGLAVRRLEVAYGEVPDAGRVAEALRDGPFAGMLVTHNETSSGVLVPVAQWLEMARQVAPDVLCVVDAVSSVPSLPLDMDAIGADAATSASQKGFMAPPGMGLVALGPRALAALKKERPGRMYFDLNAYVERHWLATPAVAHWYALDESLRLLEAEGAAAREARHVRMGRMVRAAGRAIGLRPLAPEAFASPTVTVLGAPAPFTGAQVARAARRYGAVFAGAMGPWAERGLRVGHLGATTPVDVMVAVSALEAGLLDLYAELGAVAPFAPGSGVAAALEAMREGLSAN
jgi:alanine-glyoxylate transaminase/serine-glyoxylate transaminase/serine-pyruvate transaminase